MMKRVYEYEDQDGNLYWSLRKPERTTLVGLRLRNRGRLGMHPYHFIRKVQVLIRDLISHTPDPDTESES